MARPTVDQARLPIYRALSALQIAVGVPFGLLPLLAPQLGAAIVGYTGAEPFIYRLAGAATIGHSVSGALALATPEWRRLRIALVATLVFNAAAVLAALLTLAEGGASWIVYFVLAAAALFTLISAYWLRRDEGPPPDSSTPVSGTVRALLVLATLAAAFFGLVPLLAPTLLAAAFGLAAQDLFVYRLAGAATLGYAVAGLFELADGRWEAIRVQVIAAIAFNGLSALAALGYVIGGGPSLLGPLILAAATFFTVALTAAVARRS